MQAVSQCAKQAELRPSRYGLGLMLNWIERLQQCTAGPDRCEYAVGDPAGFHVGEEIGDHLVPGALGHQGMSLAIRNDLDVTLAERDEEQDPDPVRGSAVNMGGKFALR